MINILNFVISCNRLIALEFVLISSVDDLNVNLDEKGFWWDAATTEQCTTLLSLIQTHTSMHARPNERTHAHSHWSDQSVNWISISLNWNIFEIYNWIGVGIHIKITRKSKKNNSEQKLKIYLKNSVRSVARPIKP